MVRDATPSHVKLFYFTSMKEIKLNESFSTFVDDDMYDLLKSMKWYILNSKYAISSKEYGKILMHRFIMNANKNDLIDHIDGNSLNNQKCNLRKCTHSQNMKNRKSSKRSFSKYLGVSLGRHKYKTKKGDIRTYEYWRCCLKTDNELLFIGHFNTEVESAIAYNEAALKHHKEFANLNIINNV